MTSEPQQRSDALDLLATALDQATAILSNVRDDQLTAPTPCDDWTVAQLVDHLVATPGHFAGMMRGEQPDFASVPPHVGADRAERFRSAGDDLLALWHEQGAQAKASAEWQLAELAVHTWDLATATGQPSAALDPEVARTGLGFMRANLTTENRGQAFRPAQPAQDDAGPYEEIAAFAGRRV
jgi:uncharacterized protein (TIGR03086 family)